jgi:glycosyltransferase involved in cell wall biosynthesis
MSVLNNKKASAHQNLSILWASYTIMDISINKTALIDILKSLSALGHDTFLLTLHSKVKPHFEQYHKRTISVPLRSIPLFLPVMYTTVLLALVPLSIIKFKPKIVVFEPDVHILSAFPGLLVAKIKRAKVVLDIRSIPVETIGFRGFMQKLWFSISLSMAKNLFNGITIITPLMKTEVCDQFRIDPSKVGVWTTGVSENLFNPEEFGSGNELRNELGLKNKFIVFHHGVFSPSRGLQETVKALEILHVRYPDVFLFLLGAGPAASELRAMVQESGLQDCVYIHNTVEQKEVPKFIAMADVCIVPLPYNVFWRFQCPLKLLEYLSMGKVVIATDLPSHRLVMGAEKCGIYVSSHTPAEIAKSIEYAYLQKDSLKEWGKVGRKIIQKKYEWRVVAEDLESYLSSL